MGEWRHQYVVYRFDHFQLRNGENKPSHIPIKIKEVFDQSETAEKEVKRLNILKGTKNFEYDWQSAKYYPEPREIKLPEQIPEKVSLMRQKEATSEPSEEGKRTPRFSAGLRICGEDLQADMISQQLGVSATRVKHLSGGRVNWMLKNTSTENISIEEQVEDLLNRTTDDLAVWQEITKKYRADIFIGAFSDRRFLGWEISSNLLWKLAERNLRIGFDIYTGLDAELH